MTNEGMPDSVRLSMGAWGRHEAYEEDALLYLARRTGGELQENTNRPEDATRQILRRNAVTYLLSFSPSALEGEGRYHELEVRLRNGSRAEIRHRPGYFEPEAGGGEPPAETALRDAELVLSGAGPAELGGGAIALPASSEPGQVPYFLELDGRHLADFGREVELELQVYAVHHDGSFRDATFRNFSVDVGKAGDLLRSADLRFTGSLDVEPGRYELRALVRERQSGQVSLLTSAFAVPAEGAPGPRLYLTALPSRRQVHVLQEGLKETSRGFEDFRSPQGTLLPSPEPDLGPDEILVAVLLAAPGTVAAPGAHILTSSGETVATLELVAAPADASNEDVQRWGVVLAAGQLAAGSYTLTVDVGPHGRLERHFTRRP